MTENPIELEASDPEGTVAAPGGAGGGPVAVGTQLISAWFAARGLPFVAADGSFATTIPMGADAERQELRVRALITPGNPPGILFAAAGPSTYARDQWPAALTACNVWNTTVPAPKARLAVDDWDRDEPVPVVLEAWTPLVPGLPQRAVDGLAETLVTGAVRFWTGPPADEDE